MLPMHTTRMDTFDKSEFLLRLARRIAELRKAKGYSQDRLALEAGLSRGTLSKIEAGLVEPKVSTIACLAHTLEIPVERFFKNL